MHSQTLTLPSPKKLFHSKRSLAESLQVFQEDDGGGDDQGADEAPAPEPKTKKEFYKLRAESNTTVLVGKCLQDRGLQLRLKLICIIGKYVHYDFAHALREMKEGQKGMRRFASERSAYRWYRHEITPLLQCIHSKELAEALDLTDDLDAPIDPSSCDAEWFKEEKELVNMAQTFALNLAAEEIWSQLMFSVTFPHALAGVVNPGHGMANASLGFMEKLTHAVIAAEQQVKANPLSNAGLSKLLNLAIFTRQQMSREIMAEGNNNGWTPNNSELQATADLMISGSSTTADAMEKCFNHMQDVCRGSKSKRIDNYHLWFSASSSPFTETGGMQQWKTKLENYFTAVPAFKGLKASVESLMRMAKIPGCDSVLDSFSVCAYLNLIPPLRTSIQRSLLLPY